MKKVYLYLFLQCICSHFLLHSQNSDFQSRNTLVLSAPILKKVNIGIENELLLKENCRKVQEYYVDLFTSIKVHNNLSLSMIYRYTKSRANEGSYNNIHGYAIDLNPNFSINDIILKGRVRFQSYDSEIFHLQESNPEPENKKTYIRTRFFVGYQKNKFIPFISSEIYYNATKSKSGNTNAQIEQATSSTSNFFRLKSRIGSIYNISPANQLKIYYELNQKLTPTLFNAHTLGIQLSHKIQFKKI